MSYDVYFNCPTCGHDAEEADRLNPTYNLTAIFDLALTGEPMPNQDVGEAGVVLFGEKTDRPRGLRVLSGRTGADTLRQLKDALCSLHDPIMRDKFDALAPDNGWGTVDGARRVISKMLALAEARPTSVWKIH